MAKPPPTLGAQIGDLLDAFFGAHPHVSVTSAEDEGGAVALVEGDLDAARGEPVALRIVLRPRWVFFNWFLTAWHEGDALGPVAHRVCRFNAIHPGRGFNALIDGEDGTYSVGLSRWLSPATDISARDFDRFLRRGYDDLIAASEGIS